jgi:hypothetical protein
MNRKMIILTPVEIPNFLGDVILVEVADISSCLALSSFSSSFSSSSAVTKLSPPNDTRGLFCWLLGDVFSFPEDLRWRLGDLVAEIEGECALCWERLTSSETMEEAGVLGPAELFAEVKALVAALASLALSALLASLGMWSKAATDGGEDEECCFCCKRSLMGVPRVPEFFLFRLFMF